MLKVFKTSSTAFHYNPGVVYLKQGKESSAREEPCIVDRLDKKTAEELKAQIDASEKHQ